MRKIAKIAVKNVIGVCLIVVGCIMLVTPGPGLFTLLAGLYITNFPGKPALVKRVKQTRFYNQYISSFESNVKSRFQRKKKK